MKREKEIPRPEVSARAPKPACEGACATHYRNRARRTRMDTVQDDLVEFSNISSSPYPTEKAGSSPGSRHARGRLGSRRPDRDE
jgi:hypothetical protein